MARLAAHPRLANMMLASPDFDTCLAVEFFRAFAYNAGSTLHLKCEYGDNAHHIIEALFKAFARALDEATVIDPRISGVLSTKGSMA